MLERGEAFLHLQHWGTENQHPREQNHPRCVSRWSFTHRKSRCQIFTDCTQHSQALESLFCLESPSSKSPMDQFHVPYAHTHSCDGPSVNGTQTAFPITDISGVLLKYIYVYILLGETRDVKIESSRRMKVSSNSITYDRGCKGRKNPPDAPNTPAPTFPSRGGLSSEMFIPSHRKFHHIEKVPLFNVLR